MKRELSSPLDENCYFDDEAVWVVPKTTPILLNNNLNAVKAAPLMIFKPQIKNQYFDPFKRVSGIIFFSLVCSFCNF